MCFLARSFLAFEEDWRGNLRAGIGERGTDTIYLRAFSALVYRRFAEREAKAPFLGEARYRMLLDANG